ncbi:hypothetical protein MMC07_004235 [Pseudocyphellaria aurata]|nr:hypothetical protein [Pseudocyphellaria aurata]
MRLTNFYDDAPLRAAKKSCVMILAYLTVSSITVAIIEGEETCYFPNGIPAKDLDGVPYYRCHDGDSPCCAINEACISNGLCYGSTIDMTYRGGCTNPAWVGCPAEYCNNFRSDGFANLWKCPPAAGSSGSEGYWWCGPNAVQACLVGPDASTFKVDGGSLQTILKAQQAAGSTGLTATSTINTTASITSSIRLTATLTFSTTASLTSLPGSIVDSPPITITATATATATAAVANGGSSESSGKSSNASVAIGAGVGIPLGAVALGVLGYLRWRDLRNKRRCGGDTIVSPKPTQLQEEQHLPVRDAMPTMMHHQSWPPGELTGLMVESEVVAPAPVHEIYSRPPGPGPFTP